MTVTAFGWTAVPWPSSLSSSSSSSSLSLFSLYLISIRLTNTPVLHKFNFNGCDDELLKQLQTINLVQEGTNNFVNFSSALALVVNDAKTFKQGSNSKESSNRVIGKRQKAVSPPPRWHPPPPSPPSSPPVYMNYLPSSNCRYISTME